MCIRDRGPVVAALYKGGCVGAAMSRPPFRFSALSVGAGPRPARRIAGKPDAEKIPCGQMVSVPAGDETGKHGADHIRPCGMAAAGIRGRTLCAPTEKGIPNRWDCTKRGKGRDPGGYIPIQTQIRGRTLCAPTERGRPTDRARTKGGRGAAPGGTSPYKHRYAGARCAPLRKKGHQTDGAVQKGKGRGPRDTWYSPTQTQMRRGAQCAPAGYRFRSFSRGGCQPPAGAATPPPAE